MQLACRLGVSTNRQLHYDELVTYVFRNKGLILVLLGGLDAEVGISSPSKTFLDGRCLLSIQHTDNKHMLPYFCAGKRLFLSGENFRHVCVSMLPHGSLTLQVV